MATAGSHGKGRCSFITSALLDSPHGPGYVALHSVNSFHPFLDGVFSLRITLPEPSELPPHGASKPHKFPQAQEHQRNNQPGSHPLNSGHFAKLAKETPWDATEDKPHTVRQKSELFQ